MRWPAQARSPQPPPTTPSSSTNKLVATYLKNFTYSMNALVNNVAYALYMGSPMPMLGPGADALRQPGFKRGTAWALTALKNYGSTNRAALVAECLARGLVQLGTVPELKARLGRSDDGQLEAADWLPLDRLGCGTR